MPNWCHNTLVVSGDTAALAHFVEYVRLTDPETGNEVQPLTFSAHVPEPTPDEYAAMEELQKVTCTYCGGRGKRPRTKDEAEKVGARWFDNEFTRDIPENFIDRPDCNVCRGTGRELPIGSGWYGWRVERWGCKWDANFDGPMVAFGAEGAEVTGGGMDASTTRVEYDFDSPWGPPMEWFKRMVPQETDLDFVLEYGEPGGGFAGRATASKGLIVTDEDLPIEDVLEAEKMWF